MKVDTTRTLTVGGKPFKLEWLLDFKPWRKKPVVIMAMKMEQPFEVETLEGVEKGNAGDFLIIGVKGELYPCKPDIFALTYEEAPDA
jgi:hypothetical protein